MTDVKFMDLSQNDNPATTDSVLIGNSTNGLKRTTIGAIGNILAVKGLFHFEKLTTQAVVTADPLVYSSESVTAPDVPGYTFEFWLNPVTIGVIYTSYFSRPIDKTSAIWVRTLSGQTKPIEVSATAVYVKSTVA